jgi:uncharacterized LabA/DUF88 family protein
MRNRVIALIDGFNFYHPIAHHQNRLQTCLKWLNYPELLRYYLLQIPKETRGELQKVYFFSALAKWRNVKHPGTTKRHQIYLNALKHAEVEIILGNFKEKKDSFTYRCPESATPAKCLIYTNSHEEKETDVRIACKMLELAVQDAFDTCMLLSADSDLVPAIETLKTLYPEKRVILVTPPSKAKTDKLNRLSDGHIAVGVNDLKRFQFPDVIETGDGYQLENPWQTVGSSLL